MENNICRGCFFLCGEYMSDNLANQFAGTHPDRILTLVTERVGSLNKRFDELDDKIDMWRDDDLKRYNLFELKFQKHEYGIKENKQNIKSTADELNTIRQAIPIKTNSTLRSIIVTAKENKGKIIIGVLSAVVTIIVGILIEYPEILKIIF